MLDRGLQIRGKLAVGETLILPHPSLHLVGVFNRDEEGVPAK